MKKWETETHKSWNMTVEGFKGHVATDGSLLEMAGKWGACGWAVVQLRNEAPVWAQWRRILRSSAPSRGRR